MDIPKACDLCGSSTKHGYYNQSWWICTNESCPKSNVHWGFNPKIDNKKNLIDKLANDIISNKCFYVLDNKIEIAFDERTFAVKGLGMINLINYGKIMFQIKNKSVKYYTNNEKFLNFLQDTSINSRILLIFSLIKEKRRMEKHMQKFNKL